jgi:dTDP-4-amino-4,6-dideoxygalactose transaminase
MTIPFNVPYIVGGESNALQQVIASRKLCGGGAFGLRCENQLEEFYPGAQVLMTTSCTDALEICAALMDIQAGDEILAPSFTFVSTVNPFVIRGARVKFLDIEYPSLNVNAATIESAITPRTKAVIVVNYGGGAANLREIRTACDRHGVVMIEDAAQSLLATCEGKPLGSFGQLAALSFHDTKNVHCGEGGALIINDAEYFERAEIIREKGTNRSKFFRGQVDKYSWVDLGSSHIPTELCSAFLDVQLINAREITDKRLKIWARYQELCARAGIDYVRFAPEITANAHVFGVLTDELAQRTAAIAALKAEGIQSVFHYVPLHSAPMGQLHGSFHGEDVHTTSLSARLMRLPLYPDLELVQVDRIVDVLSRALGR